jgi:hypothetical protein
MRRKYALVLAHNRPEELVDVLNDIHFQVDQVLVIDNASEPPIGDMTSYDNVMIMKDPTQPANLSRLWNKGFEWIRIDALRFSMEWDIAVLTDDVRIPPGWFDTVSSAMDRYQCVAGCSSPWPQRTEDIIKREPDRDIMNRMFGPAFIIRGEVGLKADESLHWWWGDTDLDCQARLHGGMVVVPTHPVINRYANASTTGALAERAGVDRENFSSKWGGCPW